MKTAAAMLTVPHQDRLRVNAEKVLAWLDQEVTAGYCNWCNQVGPVIGDVIIGEVDHTPECPVRLLQEGLES